MVKLINILKQILLEEKTKRDRCLRIADRKFDKPSAYKSGAVVRCRQGKIWKGINEIGDASASKYKWEEVDREGYYTYIRFITDNETEYDVDLESMMYTPKDSTSSIKAIGVEFSAKPKEAEFLGSSYNIVVNKGELYKVMATVLDIIKKYIKKFKAQAIIYTPSKKPNEDFGNQRDQLYKIFIKKSFPEVKFEQKGDMVVAILPDITYLTIDEKKQEEINEDESLHKWFNRQGAPGKNKGWVDCNTCRDGKCKPCGRAKGEKRAKYPSCRPTPSQCKRPGKGKTWGKTK